MSTELAVKPKKRDKTKFPRIRLSQEEAQIIKDIRKAKKCYLYARPFKNSVRPVLLEVTKQSLVEQLRGPLSYGAVLYKRENSNGALYFETMASKVIEKQTENKE